MDDLRAQPWEGAIALLGPCDDRRNSRRTQGISRLIAVQGIIEIIAFGRVADCGSGN